MSDCMLTDSERDILKVIKNEIDVVKKVPSLGKTKGELNRSILASEELLRSIGRDEFLNDLVAKTQPEVSRTIIFRSFDELLKDANERIPVDIKFSDIFSSEEIAANSDDIKRLNDEFNAVHKLDKLEIIIPVVAGILGGAIDCLFGGFAKAATGKSVPGTLSSYIGKMFDKALPADTIKRLERLTKVPYDALNYDNKGNVIVEEIVDGLSPVFHHQVSLGHDPILGFIFGVLDMLRGTVTTLDFNGKFLIQTAERFSVRRAQNIFQAIAKVFLHMLSDVNGSSNAINGGMGLPVPFMALFSNLQFGKIGDNNTIAELVKSMFYQGYDFRHFCAMSIPVMIIEVIVRVSYFAKRLSEGHTFSEALPIGLNHEKKPKLGTMLFIAHSGSTAINVGKILFTKNPLDINYAQWLSFARYSVKQLKWMLLDKPDLRDKYVMEIINNEWTTINAEINELWDSYTSDSIVVYA